MVGVLRPIAEGDAGIAQVGHRRYVGGDWDLLGGQQFDLLTANGLEPQHVLLDIACGSLRAGAHLIPFLEPGNYLGIEKEATLLEAGKRDELGLALVEERRPELVVSGSFEFERFSKQPDFAIARSLFTHLPAPLILDCMTKLRRFIRPEGVFLASFFRSRLPALNPSRPHPHQSFRYTRHQMETFGSRSGWSTDYVGKWVGDDSQVYVRYRPAGR
jgi:SAM-dependent methyltransferase